MNDKLVLLSDDDQSIRVVASKALAQAGYLVKTAETLSGLMDLIEHHPARVLVTDVVYPDGDALDILPDIKRNRPDLNVILMSARSTLLTAVKAQEGEVFAYIPKPFALDQMVDTVTDALNVPSVEGYATSTITGVDDDKNQLIGQSPAMQDIFRTMARLVSTDFSVMITGESGTGKEVVARTLHDLGPRKDKPFVALNMAAIPKDLIESELFGHEKGAFTGADKRVNGRFEQAKDGTLFLDEIGDMSPEAQTRLLRVLQVGEYTRVGGTELISSNARIIAATNKELSNLISQGKFREDLYFRLNVVPLRLPPLRNRTEDIKLLLTHFLQVSALNGLPQKQISDGALEILENHSWPGNVRELENFVKRSAVLIDEEIISKKHILNLLSYSEEIKEYEHSNHINFSSLISYFIDKYFADHSIGFSPDNLYAKIMDEVERPLIEKTLENTNGNQIKAAEILGLNRNTLRKKINTHSISIPSSRKKGLRS